MKEEVRRGQRRKREENDGVKKKEGGTVHPKEITIENTAKEGLKFA